MSEAIPAETLARRRNLHKAADTRIRAIYEKRAAWGALQTAYQDKLRCVYATVREEERAADAWQQLLNLLGHRSSLLAIEPVISILGPQQGNTFLDAILQVALRSGEWRRPLEEWVPASSDPYSLFCSLLHYLFADYYIPPFMDAAWFEGFTAQAEQHRDWFLHIGIGRNIRRADLPLPLTEKAAHHFL